MKTFRTIITIWITMLTAVTLALIVGTGSSFQVIGTGFDPYRFIDVRTGIQMESYNYPFFTLSTFEEMSSDGNLPGLEFHRQSGSIPRLNLYVRLTSNPQEMIPIADGVERPAVLSPNERFVYFQNDGGLYNRFYIYDITIKKNIGVIPGEQVNCLEDLPQWCIFSLPQQSANQRRDYEYRLVNTDTARVTLLNKQYSGTSYGWLPDRTGILYSERHADNTLHVVLYDIATNTRRTLGSVPDFYSIMGYTWSDANPNWLSIQLFELDSTGQHIDTAFANLSEEAPQFFTLSDMFPQMELQPWRGIGYDPIMTWIPDQQRYLIAARNIDNDPANIYFLYLIDPVTGERTRWTQLSTRYYSWEWSPGGEWLLLFDDNYRRWTIDVPLMSLTRRNHTHTFTIPRSDAGDLLFFASPPEQSRDDSP